MKRAIGIVAGLTVIYLIHTVLLHAVFTTISTADFFPRWYGAHALLVEGRDPYSSEVTTEIEAIMDPDQERTNSFNFAFPLHAIFLFLPIAFFSLDQYSWAQAFWMAAIQWTVGLTVWLLLRKHQWRPGPVALGVLVFTAIFFYPITRTILLGQFTMHVLLFLTASLLLLQEKRPFAAGVFLALTTIKPQMVVLLLPWLSLWAFSRRDWRFLQGVAASGMTLLIASLLLQPSWLLGFFNGLFDYAAVASGKPPLVVLSQLLHWPAWSATIFLLLLLIPLIKHWIAAWGQEGEPFNQALHWTLVVSLLAPFQTGTTNHVLLLIPLFAWWVYGLKARPWVTGITHVILLFGLWILFVMTLSGNYEHPGLFLPLPLFCLALLLIQEVQDWRHG